MNLPQEIIRLILSPLSTRDVIVFSCVCKETQSLVTHLPALFWLSRVNIIKHTYFTEYNTSLVKKVSHSLEKHGRDWESIFAVRDVDIIPWLEENCIIKLDPIYKYDNEVLLANYVLLNSTRDLLNSSFLIFEYNSVRCFRWLRKHTKENESTILRSVLSELLSEEQKELYKFLKLAWDDIESATCELSWMFSFYSSDVKNILIWLLEYPSLFDCNPWEQIMILLTCASDDDLWSELFRVHRAPRIKIDYKNGLYPESVYSWIYIVSKRRDVPIFQRAYDKMLSTVSWEEWDDVYKPKSIKKLRCNMKAIETRLAGTISREHVRKLLY